MEWRSRWDADGWNRSSDELMRRSWCAIRAIVMPKAAVPGQKRKAKVDGKVEKKRAGRTKQVLSSSSDEEETKRFDPQEIQALRAALLDWYDRNHRVLPWRRNKCSLKTEKGKKGAPMDLPDQKFAYLVWVSEIMLQQTRVATVIDYFDKWMNIWPTVQDLASATQEQVNDCWTGLGYYRRARYLLEGAKYVVNELGGKFPEDASGLGKIPGIGPYTAGAISSIAFGKHEPLVDGNVIRVLARLRALAEDPTSAASKKLHWELATQLVDVERSGDFNQAVMELGATICTPKGPLCGECPIKRHCQAYKRQQRGQGSVMDFPPKVEKAPPKDVHLSLCILEEITRKNGKQAAETRFLLVQRPEGGLLAGLWEFPSVIVEKEAPKEEKKRMITERVNGLLGANVEDEPFTIVHRSTVGQCTHIFSHQKHTMEVEWMLVSRGSLPPSLAEEGERPSLRWVDGAEIGDHPLTTGQKKALALLSKCTSRVARIGGAPATSKGAKAEDGGKAQKTLVGFFTKKNI